MDCRFGERFDRKAWNKGFVKLNIHVDAYCFYFLALKERLGRLEGSSSSEKLCYGPGNVLC